MKVGLKKIVLLAFCLAVKLTYSQQVFFKHYGEEEGLMENFIYRINQHLDGQLLLGTGNGVVLFDGLSFSRFGTNTHGGNEVCEALYRDDSTTAFVLAKGKLVVVSGRLTRTYRFKELETVLVTGILRLDNGTFCISTMGSGIFIFNRDNKLVQLEGSPGTDIKNMIACGNDLIIHSESGIDGCEISGNVIRVKEYFPNLDQYEVISIKSVDDNCFLLSTESKGLFLLKRKANGWTVIHNFLAPAFSGSNSIQDFCFSNDQLLVLGRTGAIHRYVFYDKQLEVYSGSVISKTALSSNFQTNTIFVDAEKNIWLGTYGQGIVKILKNNFLNFNEKNGLPATNLLAIEYAGGEKFYLATKDALFSYDAEREQVTDLGIKFKNKTSLPNIITNIGDDKLLVGFHESQLYLFNINTKQITPVLANGDPITDVNCILYNQRFVYIGTNKGLYVFNRSLTLQAHLNTNNGLPHNVVRHLFIDRQGKLWMASPDTPPYYYYNQTITLLKDVEFSEAYNITSISQSGNGKILFSTLGKGVLVYDGKHCVPLTQLDGLLNDFCYGFLFNSKGTWVIHRKGLSLITTYGIFAFKMNDYIKEIEISYNQVVKDHSNNIWIATNKGLMKVNDDQVRNDQENTLTLRRVLVNEKSFSPDSLTDFSYGNYSFSFSFKAVCLTDPQKLKYKYRLAGYSDEWIPGDYGDTVAIFSKLPHGEYTFEVLSANNDGKWNAKPLRLSFKIRKPFWLQWWFLLLAPIGFISGAYYLHVLRMRTLKRRQVKLERIVNRRTLDLKKEKENLEHAGKLILEQNKSITNSIQYAKRLQEALLKGKEQLEKRFTESFILYQPKDIVSGDFYYISERSSLSSQDLFICAGDSTGHGVPGAFMSLLNIKFLSEAIHENYLSDPTEIFDYVREKLTETLDTGTADLIRDGMDGSLLRISSNSDHAEFACANIPVVLIQNGSFKLIQQDKFSISYTEDFKSFTLHDIKLNSGDCIYLFTDGYQDQFGDELKFPMGKKFLKKRLLDLLKNIHHLPMENQQQILKDTWLKWKGNLEQTDDILIIGLRI